MSLIPSLPPLRPRFYFFFPQPFQTLFSSNSLFSETKLGLSSPINQLFSCCCQAILAQGRKIPAQIFPKEEEESWDYQLINHNSCLKIQSLQHTPPRM